MFLAFTFIVPRSLIVRSSLLLFLYRSLIARSSILLPSIYRSSLHSSLFYLLVISFSFIAPRSSLLFTLLYYLFIARSSLISFALLFAFFYYSFIAHFIRSSLLYSPYCYLLVYRSLLAIIARRYYWIHIYRSSLFYRSSLLFYGYLLLALPYYSLVLIILLGFRYLASSIPLVSLAGVAIGVGLILSLLIFSISRNPIIANILIRWAFIGSSLVEVSGSIGLVYSFLILYAFVYSTFYYLCSYLIIAHFIRSSLILIVFIARF